jgi:hypothetical protein
MTVRSGRRVRAGHLKADQLECKIVENARERPESPIGLPLASRSSSLRGGYSDPRIDGARAEGYARPGRLCLRTPRTATSESGLREARAVVWPRPRPESFVEPAWSLRGGEERGVGRPRSCLPPQSAAFSRARGWASVLQSDGVATVGHGWRSVGESVVRSDQNKSERCRIFTRISPAVDRAILNKSIPRTEDDLIAILEFHNELAG